MLEHHDTPTIAPDAYVRYLRSALADSQLGRGLLSRKELQRLDASMMDTEQLSNEKVTLNEAGEQKLSSLGLKQLHPSVIKSWFTEEPNAEWIQCVIHPYVYSLIQQHHHGAREERWVPEIIAPISYTVLINRDGLIIAHGRPGVARELLEPSISERRLTITSVDDIDEFFDINEFPDYQDTSPSSDGGRITIAEVNRYANRLLSESCSINLLKPFVGEHPDIGYTLLNDALIYRSKNAIHTIRPLLHVLDATQFSPTSQKWLSNWSIYEDAFASLKVPSNHRTNMLRLATMTNRFSLSPEQHLCKSGGLLLKEGEALAINGPPGSGKTALLQSIISSTWVKSAINRTPPPLTVIASTSNQAIINAMESLSASPSSNDGILKKRWLPGWNTYGIYLAAKTRQDWAHSQGYATGESVRDFENDCDVMQAEELYLDFADQHLKGQHISLDEAVSALQEQAKSLSNLLRSAERVRITFEQVQSREDLTRLYGFIKRLSKVFGKHPRGKRALEQLTLWIKQLDRVAGSRARQENQLISASRAYQKYLVNVPAWKLKLGSFVPAFESSIDEGFKKSHPAFSSLHMDSIKNLPKGFARKPKVSISGEVRAILRDKRWNAIIQWIDAALDVTVRHQLFLLAMHIHEGEWIIEMKNTLARGDYDRRSEGKVLRMWRRRARLAPAFVSTLHNLPRVMNYWDPSAQTERPLLGELDYLIIDEAGQCSPEISMPSLLLSKRVITVGDEHQLESVRMISEDVDGANAIASGMKPEGIDDHMALSAMASAGILSSSGSILKMTQQRSKFTQPNTNTKGLMLREHRRCRPSIIQFCNDACYNNELKIIRESATASDSKMPEIGIVHIPGVVESIQGSQVNQMEAIAIAEWVCKNRQDLMSEYPGKTLGDILGIITPFTQQAKAIQSALGNLLGEAITKDILVGTVHSIQGAERPAIIFSPAYSAHRSSPMFFERSPNLLNVTVSRARDHFIVIGDMQALSQRTGIVRKFSEHLWEHGVPLELNLATEGLQSEALKSYRAAEVLTLEGSDTHKLFLSECLLNRNVQEITILSPDFDPEASEDILGLAADFQKRFGLLTIVISLKHLSRDRQRFLNIVRPAIKTLMAQGIRVKMVEELHESGLIINGDRLVVTSGAYWLKNPDPSDSPTSLVMTLNGDSQEMKKVESIITMKSGPVKAA